MSQQPLVLPLDQLRSAFGAQLSQNAPIARLTTARVGGSADVLITVRNGEELAQAAQTLWEMDLPFHILGGGSNVLVSDAGVREVVILNQASSTRTEGNDGEASAWAESGANFSSLARQSARQGLSGLEWAAAVPGTVGGAVYGNAGAFGSDVEHSLELAEILHQNEGRQTWTVERFQYRYRSSLLKRQGSQAVILAARFHLLPRPKSETVALVEANTAQRRRTQPPGATMGSMFKNPEGDYAGRLIEAAGLKGQRVGDAEISTVHANFFVNHGRATATEFYSLIKLARETVAERFGVLLELEVELFGEFPLS